MLTETIPRFAPAFDLARERDVRRQGVLDADKNLSVAVEALKTFQGDHYALDAHGRLVPKVTVDAVSNEAVDLKHQQLVREVSACHDRFLSRIEVLERTMMPTINLGVACPSCRSTSSNLLARIVCAACSVERTL